MNVIEKGIVSHANHFLGHTLYFLQPSWRPSSPAAALAAWFSHHHIYFNLIAFKGENNVTGAFPHYLE
jgi:hypothetical protein